MSSKIRDARLKAGLTQKALSERLEIPKRTIENWEGEVNSPPVWVEKMVLQAIEDISINLLVRFRYNENLAVCEYNCGNGWRSNLLMAFVEAGYNMPLSTLKTFFTSTIVNMQMEEYLTLELLGEIERFFNVLVPLDGKRGVAD